MSSITFSHSLSLSDLAGKVAKTTKAKIKVSKVKKSIDLPAYDSLIPPLVTRISDLCLTIRKKMRFHGVESHYQGALELELQELGFLVQHEIAARIHYLKTSGESIQLPHDIRCREIAFSFEWSSTNRLYELPMGESKNHRRANQSISSLLIP